MKPYVPEQLPLASLDWKRFRRLVGPSNAALARYDGILQAMINPEVLLSPLMTQEAVLSSRIEGTQATLEEVLEYEASRQPLEQNQDVQEILNYRSAMRMAVSSLGKRPICLDLVKEIHFVLMDSVRGQNKARGEFRREQNYIGRLGARIEDASFVPPEPLSVEGHLRNWEQYVHHDDDDVLVQLAIVHAQFELIHPFLDGNGRVGRILLPLFMFEKGLLSSPMFYLSEYLEAHRDAYYDRLAAASQARDWEGWIQFFLTAIIEQAKVNTAKAKAILDLYDAKKQAIAELTRSPRSFEILHFLFGRPVFESNEFVGELTLPSRTAKRILAKLVDEGFLMVLQEASGRRPATLMFRELISIAEGRGISGIGH
jgi:Fic family protein